MSGENVVVNEKSSGEEKHSALGETGERKPLSLRELLDRQDLQPAVGEGGQGAGE